MMKTLKRFVSKQPDERKRSSGRKSMDHNGAGDKEVSNEAGPRIRTSIGGGISDVVDAMPVGTFNPGPAQVLPRPSSPPAPAPATTWTSPSDILPNPGVSRDDEYYSMRSRQRGVALIFSHENYNPRRYADEERHLPPRKGTDIDREALCRTFEDLNFEVRCFNDLCHYQITNELRRVAQQDHVHHDCVAVAVMTHGDRDGRLNARDREYYVSELWEPLTARHCPTLAGKPKLFFIQACKGDGLDPGVRVSNHVQDVSDSMRDEDIVAYPVPSYADILVSYSTFEGLYSYLNKQDGSWYVQTLCEELKAHGKTMDLISLLTEVNRIVGQKFRVRNPSKPQLVGMVQAPCFTSSLTRRLRFR